jgi:hypothetical protein
MTLIVSSELKKPLPKKADLGAMVKYRKPFKTSRYRKTS